MPRTFHPQSRKNEIKTYKTPIEWTNTQQYGTIYTNNLHPIRRSIQDFEVVNTYINNNIREMDNNKKSQLNYPRWEVPL